MLMNLVGLSAVNEGISGKNSKNPDKPFKIQDAHFMGQSLAVNGETVAKVTLDLLTLEDKLPPLILGAKYYVSLSDKGWLKDLQLVQKPTSKPTTPTAETPKLNITSTQS